MDLASHQQMLTGLAARLVGRADADDIVQETFLRALARPPDPGAPIAPWLATVARNLAVDHLRRRGRFELFVEEGAVEPDPGRSGLAELLAGLGDLSRGEVTVLLLRDALDLDVDEVAAALETSPESVRVLHHRARRKAATPAPLERGLAALDAFLVWLLAREVAGLPVTGRPADPGVSGGVLGAHLTLLDAIVVLAQAGGDGAVEGRARLSRGIARLALGRPGAEADLQAALELGADATLVAARLAPILHGRGEMAAALDLCRRGLERSTRSELAGILHRVAAQVHTARGDTAGAAPHLDALRILGEVDEQDAQIAVAQARVAMDEERDADSLRHLLVALDRVRASGHRRREGMTLNNLAFVALSLGDLPAAAAWAEAGLVIAREGADPRTEAFLRGNLATLAHLEGRLDAAAVGYEAAIALAAAQDLAVTADILRTRAAALAQQLGHLDQAARQLDAIITRQAGLPGLSLHPRVHRFGVAVELGSAQAEEGAALAAEAAALPSTSRAIARFRALAAGEGRIAAPASGLAELLARAVTDAAWARRENSGRGR